MIHDRVGSEKFGENYHTLPLILAGDFNVNFASKDGQLLGTHRFAFHPNRHHPPPNAKLALGDRHPLRPLHSAPIERLKGTWSRVPKSRRRTFRTLWELLCCPHETDTDYPTSKIEKVLSSKPFHQSVSFDHLSVWPNIQHLLEPCHFTELDPVDMGTFTYMVSTELEP
ncbi:hypothetical protein TNCT_144591 [Trichonephila clavata]|uniref:Uncharacterized protein n=1 Tax=Trichonephila clavata TaxID=2740835 RepID=A0A8X6K8U9_TRICU|nr:hypothetical protein TNCT_144591 [Trichonephila clavata]